MLFCDFKLRCAARAAVPRMLSLVAFHSYAAFYVLRLGAEYQICMLPLSPIDSPASPLPMATPRVLFSTELSYGFKLIQAASEQQGPLLQIGGGVWAIGRGTLTDSS